MGDATDGKQAQAEAQSAEAVNAQAVAAEAVEKARIAQLIAAIEARDTQTQKILVSALHEVFNENKDSKRFIDTERIPFICDDIKGIHEALKEINEDKVTKSDFQLLKQRSDLSNNIIFGFVGLICLGFMSSLMVLIFR